MKYELFVNDNGFGYTLFVWRIKVRQVCYFETRDDAIRDAEYECLKYDNA